MLPAVAGSTVVSFCAFGEFPGFDGIGRVFWLQAVKSRREERITRTQDRVIMILATEDAGGKAILPSRRNGICLSITRFHSYKIPLCPLWGSFFRLSRVLCWFLVRRLRR